MEFPASSGKRIIMKTLEFWNNVTPSVADTIQNIAPDVLLGFGRDRIPDLGTSSDCAARTVCDKVCSIKSTKS